MTTVDLNRKQINYIARALAIYCAKLQDYEDDPSTSFEDAAYVSVLAEKFRMLATVSPAADRK